MDLILSVVKAQRLTKVQASFGSELTNFAANIC
jgi:hypothetical protein